MPPGADAAVAVAATACLTARSGVITVVIAVRAFVWRYSANPSCKREAKVNRLTVATCAALLMGGITAGAAFHRWMPDRCAPPDEADKSRLKSFLRIKYKLPPGAEIGVADGGVAFGSCFRKLVFATLSGPPFRAELFASPDFRFLTKELLDARPDPKEAAERQREAAQSLVRGNVPVRGTGKAPVTLAVFSDFQCPFCARTAKVLNGLGDSEGDRLRVVYHYFPLSIHPWARPAAEAAACAQRQSNTAFWSLHDFLFAHQNELSVDNLGQHVAQWGRTAPDLDPGQFERCVRESLTSGQIEQDVALGTELGVRGTPALFVNGEPVDGSSADELRALVRRPVGVR
jgi:protein-disulfide isomerase